LYNDLYKAWKSEKASATAQPLPSDFYQKAEAYLTGLAHENDSSDERTVKVRLILKEKEVGTRLLHELREIRLRKLLALARNRETIQETNLTEEERRLAQDLGKTLLAFDQAKTEPASTAPNETVELSVVRFLQDIPEIVGTDLKIYGPYKKEDIGSLPDPNAKALVKQGAAKEIEVKRILTPTEE